MEIEEIVKLIIGIILGLETIGCLVSYKLNFLPKFNPYFYLLTIMSMIGFFVYLSIDSTLFIAENHFSTYLILFGVITLIEGIGVLILYLVNKNAPVEEEKIKEVEAIKNEDIIVEENKNS